MTRQTSGQHAGEAHAGEAHAGEAHAGEAHAGEAHAGEAHAGEAQCPSCQSGFTTQLLHDPRIQKNVMPSAHPFGATMAPVFLSNAFAHTSAADLEAVFANKAPGFAYTRVSNPTVAALEATINRIEDGMGTVAYASGMAALTAAFLSLLREGDELVAAPGLYGGTVELLELLCDLGISVRFAADISPAAFEAAITEHTRVFFVETIGNPQLDVADLTALSRLAHAEGIALVVDNTVTTPLLVRPITLGADVVVHSTSKYINGHSVALGGAIIVSGNTKWDFQRHKALASYKKYGPLALLVRLRMQTSQALGGCMSPMNAFLTLTGIETLGLRMERICSNALALAEHLEGLSDSLSCKVRYPGLSAHEGHDLARRQFGGRYGGLLTLRLGDKKRAYRVLDQLTLPYVASNIGDTKTLVVHPATTIAAHLSPQEQLKSGVYNDMIRVSVGIEDAIDLMHDFERALQA